MGLDTFQLVAHAGHRKVGPADVGGEELPGLGGPAFARADLGLKPPRLPLVGTADLGLGLGQPALALGEHERRVSEFGPASTVV
jgi:hypothetical protein